MTKVLRVNTVLVVVETSIFTHASPNELKLKIPNLDQLSVNRFAGAKQRHGRAGVQVTSDVFESVAAQIGQFDSAAKNPGSD
jgi:hypothetical protein